MAVNRDKPDLWKPDIAQSVDMYNDWFMRFAPQAFRDTRIKTSQEVVDTLAATANLTDVQPSVLRQDPGVLAALRMCCCPPLARDRLIGLACVPKSMVNRMESGKKLPLQLKGADLDQELRKIGSIIERMADRDIFPWLDTHQTPTPAELQRAASIVADRLCGAAANPIIRNAQESRQLARIGEWLQGRGYQFLPSGTGVRFGEMTPGTYAFHLNVPGRLQDHSDEIVNIPVDAVIVRKTSKAGDLPLLIEAKSAGDYTNVNKRRKEEATKVQQLRHAHGPGVEYILFLCGYFDSGYLGYEAAEGIDWVWEHRIDDLFKFGV